MRSKEYYKDTLRLDYDGEIWNDVIGYDGIYAVSNYGRVLSQQRYSNNGHLIKERILKQYIGSNNDSPQVKLSWNNIKETRYVTELVGMAFHGEKEINQVYCHKNKIKVDNRAENIEIMSYSDSTKKSYELGVCTDWGIGSVMIKVARTHNEAYDIYEDSKLVRKICQYCNRELPISEFYFRNEKGFHRNQCRDCRMKRGGIKEIGKLRDRIELAKVGLRYCSVCKELKNLDTDFYKNKNSFMGHSNNCIKCQKRLSKKYTIK